jgi:hypothetical protein
MKSLREEPNQSYQGLLKSIRCASLSPRSRATENGR